MDARRQLTNKSHSLHDIGNATTNATYLRIWSAVNQNAVAAAVVINDVQFVTNWRWPRRGGGCRPSDRRRRRHETKACLPIHCSQKPTRWEEGRPSEAASRARGILSSIGSAPLSARLFFQFQHSSSSSPSANMYFEMWCCCGHNGAVGRSRSSPRRSHHPIHPSLQLCLSRLQHSCRRRHRRRRLAAVVILGRGENPGWAPRQTDRLACCARSSSLSYIHLGRRLRRRRRRLLPLRPAARSLFGGSRD